jgi:dTDP-4-amino-4,6-dideoxygalactose transaminase
MARAQAPVTKKVRDVTIKCANPFIGNSQPAGEGAIRPVPLVDLAAQQARIAGPLQSAMARVLAHGRYVDGPEVAALEARLAAFCGAAHAVTCASGTSALALLLLARGVGRGDAVLVPDLAFAAAAEAVALSGASPVFVDVEEHSFNLDPAGLGAGVAAARRSGLRPSGVIAVDLYGRPADYPAIDAAAAAHGLWLLADAAQSFGAASQAGRVGTLAPATATSFYPSKPLGCYGDGGAVLTDDAALAVMLRSMRAHGRGAHAYEHRRLGTNARLDTLQAAVLLVKLDIFADELRRRGEIAARYGSLLADSVGAPRLPAAMASSWAQYTIRSPHRDALAAGLAARGLPTAIHYPTPLHRQPAFRQFPVADGGCPVAAALCGQVLSLPMHPYLDTATQDRIVAAIRAIVAEAEDGSAATATAG